MKLYQVADEIERLFATEVDEETGEITEETLAKLAELEIERDDLCLHLAAYAKGEKAEADAIKTEADRLARRGAVHAKRAARLVDYIAANLPKGTKLEDARAAIAWRKSSAVEIEDADELVACWETGTIPRAVVKEETTQTPMKSEIAKAIKAGEKIPGAKLVTRHNLQVR